MLGKETDLKGKVIVITGASRGIGMETALSFAKEGCKLALTYFNSEKESKEIAEKCKENGAGDVLFVKLDVRDNNSIKQAVKKIIERYNIINVLINNAGIIDWKEFSEQSIESIQNQVRTNLEGLIMMTKECFPYIKETIINISSGAGKQGFGDLTTYCATKFGVRGFTQALADGYPKLKVYSANPGMTATRMTNFKGAPASEVAGVIVNVAKGKYKVESGGDVDVWKVMGVGMY